MCVHTHMYTVYNYKFDIYIYIYRVVILMLCLHTCTYSYIIYIWVTASVFYLQSLIGSELETASSVNRSGREENSNIQQLWQIV